MSRNENKYVSISEVPAALSLFNSWDSSTRGLECVFPPLPLPYIAHILTFFDSALTALEFVQALRIAINIARQSTIVAIYQAGESLYQHFDKVCVIYEGRQVFFGPADKAR